MKRATTSLPVPDSPVSSTVVSVGSNLGRLRENLVPATCVAECTMRTQRFQFIGERVHALLEQRGPFVRGRGATRLCGELVRELMMRERRRYQLGDDEQCLRVLLAVEIGLARHDAARSRAACRRS